MADPAAVRVCEVSVRAGLATLLEDVSLECQTGEWTLLAGPTGAGKSTLMRVINGLRNPSRGTVWTLGTPIPGRRRREARAAWLRTGTVLQEIALFETKSARGNVEIALATRGFKRPAARHEAIAWLERLNMAEKVNEYPWRLSGGERQRVALARALAPRPDLLLLDEPTSALDNATAAIVFECIRELVAGGTTVIMSSHREDEVVRFCDQRVALQRGRVIEVTRANGAAGQLVGRSEPPRDRTALSRSESSRDLDAEQAEIPG